MPRPDEEEITVRLTGGGPWGFRLRGGAGTDVPLTVAKVRKKSKAYPVLEEGDRILRVNGHACSHLSYDQAMNLVDQGGPSLVLDLLRTKKVPKFTSGPKTWEQIVSSEYHTKSAAETEGLQIKSFQVQSQDKVSDSSQEKMDAQTTTVREKISSAQDFRGWPSAQITTTTRSDTSSSSQVLEAPSQRQEEQESERTQEIQETTLDVSSTVADSKLPAPQETQDVRPSTPSGHETRKPLLPLSTSPRPFTPTFSDLPKASDSTEVQQPGGKPLSQFLGPRPFTPTFTTDSFKSFQTIESKDAEKTFQSKGPRPFTPTFADAKPSQTTKFVREEKSFSQSLGPRPFTPTMSSISADQNKENVVVQQSASSFSSSVKSTSGMTLTRKEAAFSETKTKIDDMIREIEADFFDKKDSSSKQEKLNEANLESSMKKFQQDQIEYVPVVTNPKIYMPPPESEMQDLAALTRKKKVFSSSSFYEEPNAIYPTVEEQVELCRKIADSLSSASNLRSKGASMFFKRVKRSQRWVHEAPGGGGSRYSGSTTEESEAEDMPYVKVSKGPPKLKLILDPRQIQDLSTLRQQGIAFVEHTAQSPEVCRDIVRDLNSPQGRGAAMFAKRKIKSEEWVVDEERVRDHLRKAAASRSSTPATPQPRGHAAAFQGSHTLPRSQKFKMVKTPWEAALESPYGSCDSAFIKVHPNEVAETVIKAAETKLTTSCLSPQRGWSATTTDVSSVGSSVTPEPLRPDRPSFNTVPRAWGSPPITKTSFRPVQFAAAAT